MNFLEERQGKIAVENGAIAVRLKPHQIQTIEIVQKTNQEGTKLHEVHEGDV